MLYQVEQQGRQTAFVGEDGTGLVGLYPLLARAAAITENENNSFAEALSLAAAERGTPLRRVFADEAEALSHDLGHGGAAEQRAVIDLDNGRIRLEMTTGPAACGRAWMPWQTIFQRQAPTESRTGS